jgi:predicted DNA-binding protein (UPF0251 family)
MPATPKAIIELPTSARNALAALGRDLSVARLRRWESLQAWAKRMGVSVPTLMRLEAGDPGVGIGILVTALWMLGLEKDLAKIAAPLRDTEAVELSVQEAEALQASRQRRTKKTVKNAALGNKHGDL